jgi:hypothetical protein
MAVDALNSFIAEFALPFHDNFFSLKVIFKLSLLLITALTILTILFRKKYIKSFITVLSVFVILSSVLTFLYIRGLMISEIRTNGYVIVYAIDDFKSINNRIPYSKEELMDLNITDVQKQNFNYWYNKSYEGKEYFSLTINNNLLGWSYFKFREKDNRSLILTDSE